MNRVGNVLLLILVALALSLVIAVIYGALHWRARTNDLRAKLEAGRSIIGLTRDESRELDGLPLPVQRCFSAALTTGRPMVASARIVQEGQFNLDLRRNNWAPFTAKQVVIARRPGFDWDSRIRIAPAVSVFVHDAYVAGEGILDARIIGLWTLEQCRGTPETAQGELMRFLAEAAWYPTTLVPTQGVRWDAIDDTSARATLTDGTRSPLPCTADSGAMLRAVAYAFHLTLKWPGGYRRVQRRTGAGASSTSSMSSHDEPFPAAGGT